MSMISRLLKRRVGNEPPKPRAREASPRLEMLESRTLLATYTVRNTSASENVRDSLPWAVVQANYTTPGLDFINFNIPGAGVHPILLNDVLYLNDQVVIDGTSQPGYNGRPLVYVQGGATLPGLFNLLNKPGSTSSGSTIQGLGMYEYTHNAVTINRSSVGNYVQNNWIGFYSDGTNGPWLTTGRFNRPTYYPVGIGIQSSYNVVRGNTISGLYNGVAIGDDLGTPATSYVSNSVQGNYIGTDPTGSTSARYGNQSDGIYLGSGSRQNFIGPDNVSSGNESSGVELLHSTVTENVIFRNKLGTDRSGNVGIPNGELGILVANGSNGNAIGGPFGGNLISGNVLGGIALGTGEFPFASRNYVQYNIFGLNASQTGGVGRPQNVGVTLESGSSSNVVEGNVMAGNVQHGILMSNTQANNVSDNWIGQSSNLTWFENGVNGIALLSGASFNFIRRNAFGANRFGPFYIDPGAVGNDIR